MAIPSTLLGVYTAPNAPGTNLWNYSSAQWNNSNRLPTSSSSSAGGDQPLSVNLSLAPYGTPAAPAAGQQIMVTSLEVFIMNYLTLYDNATNTANTWIAQTAWKSLSALVMSAEVTIAAIDTSIQDYYPADPVGPVGSHIFPMATLHRGYTTLPDPININPGAALTMSCRGVIDLPVSPWDASGSLGNGSAFLPQLCANAGVGWSGNPTDPQYFNLRQTTYLRLFGVLDATPGPLTRP